MWNLRNCSLDSSLPEKSYKSINSNLLTNSPTELKNKYNNLKLKAFETIEFQVNYSKFQLSNAKEQFNTKVHDDFRINLIICENFNKEYSDCTYATPSKSIIPFVYFIDDSPRSSIPYQLTINNKFFYNYTDISTNNSIVKFRITPNKDLTLNFNINIYNGFYTYYLFTETFQNSITLLEHYKPFKEDKAFSFLLPKTSQKFFYEPLNIPIRKFTDLKMNFTGITSLSVIESILATVSSNNLDPFFKLGKEVSYKSSILWNNRATSIYPMQQIPYASDCDNYGAYLPLWEILSDKNYCQLKEISETEPISPYNPTSSAVSDKCNAVIKCRYSEAILVFIFLKKKIIFFFFFFNYSLVNK